MSSRPPARGRDAGVVTGDGLGTSRLQRVLATGSRERTPGAICADLEGRKKWLNRLLTYISLIEEEEGKEEMVNKALGTIVDWLQEITKTAEIPDCVTKALMEADGGKYATRVLDAVTKRRNGAVSSHEQTSETLPG